MTPFEAIRAKIRDELNRITDATINGSCADFPAYRFDCGTAYGLVMAEAIVKEIEAALFRDDSDEDRID
jgi:hypothetical protein